MNEALTIHDPKAPISSMKHSAPSSPKKREKIVVIGSGPVGIRFASELLKRKPDTDITVFGNEPYQPYNRVQLSSLLAGDIRYDDILTTLPDNSDYPHFSHIISAIRKIDSESKEIIDINGNSYAYDKCVIATGSRPHKPNINGVDLKGVYTFRNLKDAESLYARASSARNIVVVGGGLLGLEAAKAMLRFNTKVTLVQQGPRLMNRQLDDTAAAKLQTIVEDLGIRVITNSGVREIQGEERVSGVITRNKETIPCDTVLLCAGIKPNIELARSARISIANAILVNDQLETSVSNVYSIGECCEHRGSTYGLVNPGYEQAAILAENLSGGHAHYVGSLEVSRLKVLGASICSMGEVSDLESRPLQRKFRYTNKKSGIYRKIVLHKGRIIGAVGFGPWEESRRVQEAYQNQRRVQFWHILSFLLFGKLYRNQETNINLWPKTAVVCQCNNINLGQCSDAIDAGNNTLEKLQRCTSAGTVCGSCKPLLGELLGFSLIEKEKAWIPSLLLSLVATLIALAIIFIPGLSVSDSVQTQPLFENFWNDKYWKQVSGFSLLGLTAIGLLMSLRKRLRWMSFGNFAYWRLLHVFLGAFCIALLVAHTGFHLGSNLNKMLMINFLSIIFIGAVAATLYSLSHKLGAHSGKRLKIFWTWIHIVVTWPLPVLLGYHILSVYYF